MTIPEEIERLRHIQSEAARRFAEATTPGERSWHMLGIADYVMEEVLIISEGAGTPGQHETA